MIRCTDDYSMGYVGEPGFRAGISIPFPFYNLLDEKETALMVHPFAFMDRGLKDYLKEREEFNLLVDNF